MRLPLVNVLPACGDTASSHFPMYVEYTSELPFWTSVSELSDRVWEEPVDRRLFAEAATYKFRNVPLP